MVITRGKVNKLLRFKEWLITHRPTYLYVYYILNLRYIEQYITTFATRQLVRNMIKNQLSDEHLLYIYNEILQNIRTHGKISGDADHFDEMIFVMIYIGLYFNTRYNDIEYINTFYDKFYELFIHEQPHAFNKVLTDIRFHLM
jgi:hypothetical protein